MNILLYLCENFGLTDKMQELLNITSFFKKNKSGKIYLAISKENGEVLKKEFEKWNIDKIFLLEDYEKNSLKRNILYFEKIMKQAKIDCIFMGNSIFERELAPYLTATLNWKFVPNITGFEIKDKDILWKRFLYGTKAIEEISIKDSSIIVTISSNIYNKDEKSDIIKDVVVENIGINEKYDESAEGFILKSREEKTLQKHPLETARIVIGVGKGIKGKENFPMIEELADILGATIGATRSVVDNGWRPEYEKIGQTGKIIKPELYLGFGISGAMQHMAGVQQARHIIMVNNNPNAESFRSSDFGIVADLFYVVPKMIEILKK